MSPDHRKHRGAHPEDARLFRPDCLPALQSACADMAWLLGRGYAPAASLKLTGDLYLLDERQRTAIMRAVCSDASRDKRRASCLPPNAMTDQDIHIDGFNLLITVEAAMGGGLILRCRDDCLRDLASVHSTYKAVEETVPALALIGDALQDLAPRSVRWLLDSPVSNSGRLAQTIHDLAAERDWNWQAETVFSPDAVLKASADITLSTDSLILDAAARWINFAEYVISRSVPQAWIVALCGE